MLARMSSRPGSYRILTRSSRAVEDQLEPALAGERRVQRILASLLAEIRSDDTVVRARRVFERPREIFRLEIERAASGYSRTTLLDRDALDELLEHHEVRARVQLG
jgi:hypothetical protein